MKHLILDGTITHNRLHPKKHHFVYPFFMLNIHTAFLQELKNRYFGLNKFNLFSFFAKDHFGKTDDFNQNIDELLQELSLNKRTEVRFVTLPRIFGFVFNPISVLLLINEDKVEYLLAEVHNYNGGRVVYKVKLDETKTGRYYGECDKNMYVSPYFEREGHYTFNLHCSKEHLLLNVNLYQDNKKVLTSTFQGHVIAYTQKNLIKMFYKHTILTFGVVFKTLYQSIILKFKGLKWHSVTPQDQRRRY